MRHRLRRQLTLPLVISIIALVIAASGTAAIAAVIITSNSQVAQNTISGHTPPKGDHANIIAGSLAASDLSPALRTSLKVHCPTGTLAAGDLCYDSTERAAASFFTALKTCASAGRRLWDYGDAALVFDHLGAPQPDQWVALVYTDDLVTYAGTIDEDDSRSLNYDDIDLVEVPKLPYRCITSPMN